RRMVAADSSDIEYLMKVLGDGFPHLALYARDIVSSFAGLRALVIDSDAKSPSDVPREETILESASGLLSVAGGKLTTHRAIAEKVVDRVMKRLRRKAGRSPTRTEPLPGARPLAGANRFNASMAADTLRFLKDRYGTRAALVERIAAERPELAEPLAPRCPAIGAEVVHA